MLLCSHIIFSQSVNLQKRNNNKYNVINIFYRVDLNIERIYFAIDTCLSIMSRKVNSLRETSTLI